ncbi:MAG: hypothetical protein ACOZB3_07770 [Calditrichota bacterium]
MRKIILFLSAVALMLQGCAYLQPKEKAAAPEGFGTSRQSDLVVTPTETAANIEWGIPYEIPLDASWAAGQKYAVQLSIAEGTPRWLSVEILPAIIEPPGRAILKITAALGDAELGETELVIESSAYGMREPLRTKIALNVQRQMGEFAYLEAAPVTRECRNVCGKVKDGLLSFYDVLREKNQTCDEDKSLPETQRIGILSFGLSAKGYGFGRTCRVAGIFEGTGTLSFFNIGLTTLLPRGASMLTIRGATDCWLSPDNTVALVKLSGSLIPYDVISGKMLGSSCRVSRDPTFIRLEGSDLAAETCSWKIK